MADCSASRIARAAPQGDSPEQSLRVAMHDLAIVDKLNLAWFALFQIDPRDISGRIDRRGIE